jgi:molybdenum cofactor cytidylyltransferase
VTDKAGFIKISNFKFQISDSKPSIGLVLLAAGEGKRFGDFPKQLLEFRGKTLLRNAVENALSSSVDLVCVVLGATVERLETEIEDLSIEIVFNENWADGMISSLQKGLRKLLEIEPKLAAVCVTLCDQPLVDSSVINRLIENFQLEKNLIVASEYAETIGVPAVFSCAVFEELLNLESSEAAKKIILKHLQSVKKIAVPEGGFDIDLQTDYEFLLKNRKPENSEK